MAETVFVSGASGFTGSNLCRKLAERGDRVRALVRRSSNLKPLQGLDIELVYGDLSEGGLPQDALKGVEKVYHTAAMYRKEGASEAPFYDVNAAGTERLLQASLRAGVSKFVHCSTVGVLGHIKNPPANEQSDFNPGDVYQRSKLQGELKARAFFAEHGLPGVVVRPAAIYGPGDMRFLKLFRAINRGSFVMIGSGTTFYHLVHVEDLTDGMILAGAKQGVEGEVFIIAGDHYISLKELTQMIAEVLQRKVSDRHVPVWPVMLAAQACQKACRAINVEPPLYPRRLDFFIKSRAFDISKAKSRLGYTPKVDLRTGLAQTASWYRAQGYL